MKYLNKKEIEDSHQELFDEMKLIKGEKNNKIFEITTSFIKNKDAKILDCGCGSGKFMEALSDYGYRSLCGLDIDNYLTTKINIKEFKAVDISFDKIPWQDEFFDVVTAIQVIEHLENPHNFIRETYRILQPGGLFIFSMPNIQHILNRLLFLKTGDMPRYRAKNNHIALFPKGIFKKSVLKYFDLLDMGYIKGEFLYGFLSKFKFPENTWFGRDVYYVLKRKKNI